MVLHAQRTETHPGLREGMVMEMVVSAESLRNAEKAIKDLQIMLQNASPAEKPAVQGRLDVAIRHYELLRQSRVLGT
jgi:hypothetical protein